MNTIITLLLALFTFSHAANHTVYVGGSFNSNPAWTYLDFFPDILQVSPGDYVHFTVIGFDAHTVTFVPDNAPNPGRFAVQTNGSVLLNSLTLPTPLSNATSSNATTPTNSTTSTNATTSTDATSPTNSTSSMNATSSGSIVEISSPLMSYISSGILSPSSNYTVRITASPGTVLKYVCIIHPFMIGFISVVSNTTSVSMDTNITSEEISFVDSRVPLLYTTKALNNTTPSSRMSGNGSSRIWTVRMVGDEFLGVSYLRFVPSNFTIRLGDTVEFVNDNINDHIVAFNSSLSSIPPFLILNQVNPVLINPSNNTSNYTGGFATSGLLQPPIITFPFEGFRSPKPSFWNITFGAPGVFYYNCPIHQSLGMTGIITVAAPSNPILLC